MLPEGWDPDIPNFPADEKGLAGRVASGKVLNAIAQRVPWLIGGAADLAPSTNTRLTFEGAGDFSAENCGGRNFHFGVREHAMSAILNGMSLSKIRAYGSGFLIFSDYARPAIRLSALMEIPTIHIFTHDSIGVGEDGPTHQPVEQLASLRAIPGLIVLRPADANEVAEAWRVIMQLRHEPVVLILTRQNLPTLDRSRYASAAGVARGAYVLADAENGKPDVLLMAHRQRGLDVRLRPRATQVRGHRRPGDQHAVVGALRASGSVLQGLGHSAGRHRAGGGREGLDPRAGPATRGSADRSSACEPSAPRRRLRSCSADTASCLRTSSPPQGSRRKRRGRTANGSVGNINS